ncbi:hypothetical protein BC628DRAFT_496544 [Trametes gibbosa]|nr:hypothetical protein BC628DRAFT_496544 [Trametes gibbosa]
MQVSGSTHRLAKRSVALDPPIIAGIVVVVVLLNLVLGLSFYTFRARQRRRTHNRRISGPVDCEKYEKSIAFAVATGAVPGAFSTQAGAADVADRKSYFDLIQALQQQPRVPSSTRLSRGSSSSSTDSTRLSDYVLRPQDIKELSGIPRYPKAKGRVQALRRSAVVVSPEGAALRRSNSLTETASVYSSASAPLEYHEQLFRTQPFAIAPNAPGNNAPGTYALPKPPPPAASSQSSPAVDGGREHRSSPPPFIPAIQPHINHRRPSHPDVPSTPTMSPASTQSPHSPRFRVRANSNPHAPAPQVLWLPSTESSAQPAAHASRRPSSVSSLSTILSIRQPTSGPTVAEPSVAPLNIRRRSKEPTEGLPSSPTSGPTLPARSPKRLAIFESPASVEGSESTRLP